MPIVEIDKEAGAVIFIHADGTRQSYTIVGEDTVVSVPLGSNLKIDLVYINTSNQLVLVLQDGSEIIVTGVTDHGDLTGVTASQHHTKYTDTEAKAQAEAAKLDDHAAPDDNADLDFSTSLHGLVPKGTNVGHYLKDDGTWATVVAGITSAEALAYALSN